MSIMGKTTSNIGVSMPSGYVEKLRSLAEETHIPLSRLVSLALEEKYKLKRGDNSEYSTRTHAVSA
jgi:hypothetical protein